MNSLLVLTSSCLSVWDSLRVGFVDAIEEVSLGLTAVVVVLVVVNVFGVSGGLGAAVVTTTVGGALISMVGVVLLFRLFPLFEIVPFGMPFAIALVSFSLLNELVAMAIANAGALRAAGVSACKPVYRCTFWFPVNFVGSVLRCNAEVVVDCFAVFAGSAGGERLRFLVFMKSITVEFSATTGAVLGDGGAFKEAGTSLGFKMFCKNNGFF